MERKRIYSVYPGTNDSGEKDFVGSLWTVSYYTPLILYTIPWHFIPWLVVLGIGCSNPLVVHACQAAIQLNKETYSIYITSLIHILFKSVQFIIIILLYYTTANSISILMYKTHTSVKSNNN